MLRVHTHVREDAIGALWLRLAARAGSLRAPHLDQRHRPEAGAGGCCRGSIRRNWSAPSARRTSRVSRAIPGVGKKTAERIGLELKDRLPQAGPHGAAPDVAGTGDSLRDDLLSALMNLGYQRATAEKSIDAALKNSGGSFEDVLRDALRGMMK